MMTSTFTTFDMMIIPTNIQEHAAIIFMFIPLIMSGAYWLGKSPKNMGLFSSIAIINNLVKTSRGATLMGMNSMFIMIFMFILSMNLWGLIPYVFPVTSHMSLTLSWSVGIWGTLVLLGVSNSYNNSIKHYLPHGSSYLLSSFLILVELISSIIRPLTLAFRLSANITAGHVILGLSCSGVSFMMMNSSHIYLSLPILYTMFESVICLAQAYVFILLCTMYSNDYV